MSGKNLSITTSNNMISGAMVNNPPVMPVFIDLVSESAEQLY
jgi:hypothetical protein